MKLADHWVQIQETTIIQAGQANGVTTLQHPFAAITCSKRCAIAVLTAQLTAEDAERRKRQELHDLFRSATDRNQQAE